MTEFKQIIGRGTRVRDDYGKLFFSILDYTGSATGSLPTRTSTATRSDIGRLDDEIAIRRGAEARSGKGEDGARSPDEPAEGRTAQVLRGRRPGRNRRTRRLRAGPGRQSSFAWSSTPTTPPTRCGRSDPGGRALRPAGPTRSARRSSQLWRSTASIPGAWRERPASPTPTPSTCSATSPSMRRCAPAGSGPSGSAKGRADFLGSIQAGGPEILIELLEKYVEHGTAQFKMPDILKVPTDLRARQRPGDRELVRRRRGASGSRRDHAERFCTLPDGRR